MKDSLEPRLFNFEVTIDLWEQVRDLINALDCVDYNSYTIKILIGDLKNPLPINSIKLLTKKWIYNAMRNDYKSYTYKMKSKMFYIKGK